MVPFDDGEVTMTLNLITTAGAELTASSIPMWLDLMAVVVGSAFGTLTAEERRLDLVGHLGLSIICGLGGGLLRDVIMQVGDVYMLRSPYAIWAAVAAALGGFFFPASLTRHPHVLEWVDIVSVGLYVAAGTDKAIVYALSPIAAILMGTMTGVGGGMLCDVFLGDVPRIFQRSNYYATCAIAGSLAYWSCVDLVHLDEPWAVAACLLVTVGLRRWSLRYGIYSPAGGDVVKRLCRGPGKGEEE